MDILVISTRWDICLFSRSECDSVCLLLLVLPRRPNRWNQWPELLVAVRGMNGGLNVYNLKHIIAGFRHHWKWISQMAIKVSMVERKKILVSHGISMTIGALFFFSIYLLLYCEDHYYKYHLLKFNFSFGVDGDCIDINICLENK